MYNDTFKTNNFLDKKVVSSKWFTTHHLYNIQLFCEINKQSQCQISYFSEL